jgi:regulatory protein spx
LGSDELNSLAALGGVTVKELLNPKSSSFKSLETDPGKLSDQEAAALINENPRIMRRPLLTDGRKLAIGFNPDQYGVLTG